jgi:hypothetical protein
MSITDDIRPCTVCGARWDRHVLDNYGRCAVCGLDNKMPTISKATQHGIDLTCTECGADIKKVLGGHGSLWVHTNTGLIPCDRQERANFLVRSILKLGDHLAPIMMAHFQDLTMDTIEDQELVERIRLLVQPWYDKTLALRALSNGKDTPA